MTECSSPNDSAMVRRSPPRRAGIERNPLDQDEPTLHAGRTGGVRPQRTAGHRSHQAGEAEVHAGTACPRGGARAATELRVPAPRGVYTAGGGGVDRALGTLSRYSEGARMTY